jgi:hypothetical protein
MKVVVTTPEDFVGNVTGDLNRRRGLIVNSEQRWQHPRGRGRGAAERDVRLHHRTPLDEHGRASS